MSNLSGTFLRKEAFQLVYISILEIYFIFQKTSSINYNLCCAIVITLNRKLKLIYLVFDLRNFKKHYLRSMKLFNHHNRPYLR